MKSSVVGACIVQSSVIVSESQMLPTTAGPTLFSLLGAMINMQFLLDAEPLWKLEKNVFYGHVHLKPEHMAWSQ